MFQYPDSYYDRPKAVDIPVTLTADTTGTVALFPCGLPSLPGRSVENAPWLGHHFRLNQRQLRKAARQRGLHPANPKRRR